MKTNDVIDTVNTIINRIATAVNSQEAEEDTKRLKDNLYNPATVLENPLLGEDHYLKQEALIIVDAFESVTNGMENPDAVNNLNLISKDSPFFPWKKLIAAIDGLYKNNVEEVSISISEIPEGTQVSRFIPFFEAWLAGSKPENDVLKKLYDEIFSTDAYIAGSIDQLIDAIENDIEDIFIETANLCIRTLNEIEPAVCKQLSVWVFQNGGEAGFDITPVLSIINNIFGFQEGYRLAALSFFYSDPDISLYFFLKSLPYVIHDTSKSVEYIIEYLSVCSELLNKADSMENELQLDVQYWKNIESLVSNANAELRHQRNVCLCYEPDLDRNIWCDIKSEKHVDSYSSFLPSDKQINKSTNKLSKSRSMQTVKQVVQLELFS